MLNVNRVTLLGHVGRDPELHTSASGDRGCPVQFGHHGTVEGPGRGTSGADRVASRHRVRRAGRGWWRNGSARAPQSSSRAA